MTVQHDCEGPYRDQITTALEQEPCWPQKGHTTASKKKSHEMRSELISFLVENMVSQDLKTEDGKTRRRAE